MDIIERQTFFNMPLHKVIVLFFVLLFALIAIGSSFAYYFGMKKVMNESAKNELKQMIDTRQMILKTKLSKEILLTEILTRSPTIKKYFLNPENEDLKNAAFNVFSEYKDFFSNKMLSWINAKDLKYYVNGQFMEQYNHSRKDNEWFFNILENKNFSYIINIDFDRLNRQIYDLYINYPVYHENEIIGTICSRIALIEFINILNLPENIFIFDQNGIIRGAENKKLVEQKKNIKELPNLHGEYVYKAASNMDKSTDNMEMFHFEENHYLISNILIDNIKDKEEQNIFMVASDKIDMKRIMQERTSIVFFILLLLMLLVFVIFYKFISSILKPINKNMQAYIESSLMDELTKLPNRRFFNIRMEDEWNRAVRGKYPLCFLMLDLDKFKNYNDTHGHLEGDRLLRDVARIVSYCVNRTSDFAARFGGEEFCVILPNTKSNGAKKIAESIRAAMERTGKATLSIGLVCKVPSLEDDMQEFMGLADKKLYEAKETGRNKVCE
jgi:diguanylate cyclase (GGDEF)-like protein